MKTHSVIIKGALKLQTTSEREAVLFLVHRLVCDPSLYSRSHILVTDCETLQTTRMLPRQPLIKSFPSWM